MAKLTENTVLARTRAQDLRSVRKLNCWGSELTDVSIIRSMPNVEVLSLSVNCISSLEDFSHCSNLQELYIRENNISNLTEIQYLQNLSKLRILWLADNPCAESHQYRLTVIRALPQLQKLDNIAICPEELESANKFGFKLDSLQNVQSSQESSFEISVSFEEVTASKSEYSSVVLESSISQETSKCSSEGSPLSANLELPKLEICIPTNDNPGLEVSREEKLQNMEPLALENISASCTSSSVSEIQVVLKEDGNGCHETGIAEKELLLNTLPGNAVSTRCTSNTSNNSRNYSRSERPSPLKLLPKGGKNRTSNILSAVLCLIKELDWPSLEVVDTAIHCQMEEIEEQQNSG